MCYFSAERFCIGHCSVFLDNSKRLKVNSGILDGYTGILNLESFKKETIYSFLSILHTDLATQYNSKFCL
jgi:hypothetical protein